MIAIIGVAVAVARRALEERGVLPELVIEDAADILARGLVARGGSELAV